MKSIGKKLFSGCLVATMAASVVAPMGVVNAGTKGVDLTPKEAGYGYYVDNYKNNIPANMSVTSNPTIGVLSGYLDLWTPGTEWNNGTKKNAKILDENIKKSYEIAGARTKEQAKAAYDDEFNDENYSMVSGLGKYADEFVKNAGVGSNKEEWNTDEKAKLFGMVDLVNCFRQRSEASTNQAKGFYKYPRPYRWNNETQEVVTDGIVESQIVPEISTRKKVASKNAASDGGFPSGHTNAATISAIGLAYAVPEQFDALIMRAAELGNNRIVAGMHSPLDVMGGRMTATALSASALYNKENKSVKEKAYADAHKYLVSNVKVETATASDYETYKKNLTQYKKYMTYDFEQINSKTEEVRVPKGAEVLLETRLPYLSDEERRYVLYSTGIESGYPVLDDTEGWGRLNLYAAANGYGALVKDTTVTMNATLGGYHAKDNWLNDIKGIGALTKDGTGELVLAGNNSFSGGANVQNGTLTATNSNAFGQGSVINSSVVKEEVKGNVNVANDYTQKDKSTLILNIASDNDVLNIKDQANLDGNLIINIANGYTPKKDLAILKAASIKGAFDTVTINGASKKVIRYSANGITLVDPAASVNQPSDYAKKGNTYTVSGQKFKVTSAKTNGKGTVTFQGVSKKKTSVSIAATVKIKNVSYKVTAINTKALKNNKKVKKITIGKNVKKIGKQAFYGCKNLKKIVVKSTSLTKKSIGTKAFSKLNKKVAVTVPKKKKAVYKKAFRARGLVKSAKVK